MITEVTGVEVFEVLEEVIWEEVLEVTEEVSVEGEADFFVCLARI